jgi:hypothetical protein
VIDPAHSSRPRWRPDRVSLGRLLVATFGLQLLVLAFLCNALWEKFHG